MHPFLEVNAMGSDKLKSGWPVWLIIVIIIVAVLLVVFFVVVIACAGMLFAVRAPLTQQANSALTEAQFFQIEGALRAYEVSVGEYPTTEQGLEALLESPTGLADPDQWRGPYLEVLPLDAWDNPYQYEREDGSPSLWSLGPDGIDGTDDDIGHWIDGPGR
jgi:general secretion pathway protein G